jgi:hypothetical protein
VFPRLVNTQQAPGVEGDFVGANPRFTVLAGQSAFSAAAAGVVVGAFCWADATNHFLSSTGVGSVTGFMGRQGQRADIVTPGPGFPDASMMILGGSFVTAYSGGDFFVRNNGSTTTVIGNKAYAFNNSGLASFAATGTPTVGATCTSGTLTKNVSASTGGALPVANTCTGSIAGTTLTVSALGSGSVLAGGVGQSITGTGIDPGTVIVSQLTGTAGSTGTYQVSISQTAASTAITLSGGGLTLTGANTSGIFAPGMTISGTNIPTGTTILAYGTGTAGGAGTYLVNNPAATAATASTITAANSMLLTVDSSSTGVWALNDIIEGSGVATGQFISATAAQNANLTGLGGAGTYLTGLYQSSALTAQTISVYSNTETKWYAMSIGAPGELVKISDHALG